MAIAMNRTALVSRVLVLVTTLTAGLGAGCITEGEAELAPTDPAVDSDLGSDDVPAEARSHRRSDRIAIVGAGPSGLSAALKLKQLGYTNVTVFEKENRVGGKVNTLNSNGLAAELGAVFASPDYREVLRLARERNIPVAEYTVPRFTYVNGAKLTPQQFLARYNTEADPNVVARAVQAYAATLAAYPQLDHDGFTTLPPELLNQTFTRFAAAKGFTPIAELARATITGFGYSYYEDMPAAYGMKILPWLVKVGPNGLQQPTYYTFPTGFQSLWTAVASELNVRLSSPVVDIDRDSNDDGRVSSREPKVLTIDVGADGNPANDTTETFDTVIVTIPLNKVKYIMDLEWYEDVLFAKVDTDRYFVSLFTSPNLTRGETVFVDDTARLSGINRVNAWGNRDTTSPIFIGYQLVDHNISPATIVATLAADIASLGQAAFGSVLFQKEWPDYFPSVSKDYAPYFFHVVESLQGNNGIYYLGGTVAFETVEHTTRFALSRVDYWF
jgi:oxygen-dependent protoporphyrinogen oxidase